MFAMPGELVGGDRDGQTMLIVALTNEDASHLVFEGPMAIDGSDLGTPQYAVVTLLCGEDEAQIRTRIADYLREQFEAELLEEPGAR